MTPGQRLRQLANVLNATTPLGLLLAGCARTPVHRGPRGLLIATGYRWRLPFAGAFTVGNVVLFRAGPGEAMANQVLLRHEERHSTQYAWCLGLPFLPLYFLAAGWSLARTGNPGSRNVFERQAGLRAGGYPELKRAPKPRIRTAQSPAGSGRPGSRRSGSGHPTGPAAPERNETLT
ncbi:MAG TPA: hypothetical protein VLT34_09350 [Arthrobacter sp.]|nr:hypothetical protein [Arthrobacter sp.]